MHLNLELLQFYIEGRSKRAENKKGGGGERNNAKKWYIKKRGKRSGSL
jgi:hypothetical protein